MRIKTGVKIRKCAPSVAAEEGARFYGLGSKSTAEVASWLPPHTSFETVLVAEPVAFHLPRGKKCLFGCVHCKGRPSRRSKHTATCVGSTVLLKATRLRTRHFVLGSIFMYVWLTKKKNIHSFCSLCSSHTWRVITFIALLHSGYCLHVFDVLLLNHSSILAHSGHFWKNAGNCLHLDLCTNVYYPSSC